MSARRFPTSSAKIDREAAYSFLRKNSFILLVLLSAVAVYSLCFSAETITTDGSDYMLLGRHMATGTYTETFLHRLPMLPALFAVFESAIGTVGARYVIPLIFMLLSLILSFMLFRELTDEKTAKLSLLVLMCFPQFWRWGSKFLTDIPMMALSVAFIILFERALVDRRMFYLAGVVAALGLLTKISFIVVCAAMISYNLIFRRKQMLTREMLIGGVLCAAIFASAFLVVLSIRSADDMMLLTHMVDSTVTGSRLSGLMQLMTGDYGDIEYFAKLAMFPLLVFLPVGVISTWRKNRLPAFFTIFVFLFMFCAWIVRLRYYSAIFPFAALLCAAGFMHIRGRTRGNTSLAITALFVFLMLLSFSNSLYMMSLDSTMLWGAESLRTELLQFNGLVATEYAPHYINLTSDVLSDRDTTDGIFYSDRLNRSVLLENGVDYLILSVYGEFARDPSDDTYAMMYGPFTTPIQRPYTGERVPPDYTFRSQLFHDIQASPWMQQVATVENPRGQTAFIIYKVL